MLTRDLLNFVRYKLALLSAFDRNTKYSWAFAIFQNFIFIMSLAQIISSTIKIFYLTNKAEIYLMIVILCVWVTIDFSAVYLRLNKKKIYEIFVQCDEIHKMSAIILGKQKVDDDLFQWHKKFKKYVSI